MKEEKTAKENAKKALQGTPVLIKNNVSQKFHSVNVSQLNMFNDSVQRAWSRILANKWNCSSESGCKTSLGLIEKWAWAGWDSWSSQLQLCSLLFLLAWLTAELIFFHKMSPCPRISGSVLIHHETAAQSGVGTGLPDHSLFRRRLEKSHTFLLYAVNKLMALWN